MLGSSVVSGFFGVQGFGLGGVAGSRALGVLRRGVLGLAVLSTETQIKPSRPKKKGNSPSKPQVLKSWSLGA